MKIKMFPKLVLTTVCIVGFSVSNLFSQSVGFGCLGLSGIYGGYSIQKYDAKGLNQFLQDGGYSDQAGMVNDIFKEGAGFRIGANIFRVQSSGSFLTVKGYYQFIREKENLKNELDGHPTLNRFELKMDHWGVGVDFGTALFSIMDWKIIEGGVNFYKTRLTHEIAFENGAETEDKYELPKTTIGYYAGTGFVLHVIPGYLSIEGTATYSYVEIDYLWRKSDYVALPNNGSTKFVENGGFSSVIQLNLGVPL